MKDITVILGPTGVGKTEYAVSLARQTGAEIISADAYQVYRGMDIGTAKVSRDITQEIPHHLIDILDPTDAYSVSDFIDRSRLIIEQLRAKKKPIIICGGTAFYLHAFLYGYSLNTQESDPEIKAKLEQQLATEGPENLWRHLESVDPKTAAAIHPNNHRRVQRALEIYLNTGTPPSQLRTKQRDPRSDCHIIGITRPRPLLYEKINARVEHMIQAGLIQEVQNLLASGVSETAPSFSAIGYKEVIPYLKGGITVAEMINLIQQHTRNFAKRQLTWYKQFEHVIWHDS